MSLISEQIFTELKSFDDIAKLVGNRESLYLECKTWPGPEKAKKPIAKAASGFANAAGGVLLLGVDARKDGEDQADKILRICPFENPASVADRAVEIIQQVVEPNISGVDFKVFTSGNSNLGVVCIHIPEADGAPRRSRDDWKFYQRLSTCTAPMEFFQIEERFGRRPHPRLRAKFSVTELRRDSSLHIQPFRIVEIVIENRGRGLARYPSLSVDGLQNATTFMHLFKQLQLATGQDTRYFRGGSEDVIFPGQALVAATFLNAAHKLSEERLKQRWDVNFEEFAVVWCCDELALTATVFAEDMPPDTCSFVAERYVEDAVEQRQSTIYGSQINGWMG